MSPRQSAAHDATSRGGRMLPPLSIAVFSALVIAALYFAQADLIPFALAVLLTFLLSPAVSYLQYTGLSRGPAVALVIVLTFCLLGAAGWVVTSQIKTLAVELPNYRHNIAEKVRYLRSMGKGGVLENVQETFKDVQDEFGSAEDSASARGAKSPSAANPPAAGTATSSFDFGSLAKGIGSATLVLGLVIFMLAQREELRNRLIRVVGYAHLAVTTRALDDAGQRIGNYLLMQIAINGCFGLVVAIALFLIGLPYAFLWGLLSVPLLFIPVFGFWTAAALPTILSLAVFRGWWWPLLIIGLFFVLKTIINMVLEPLLYGRSVGVFPVPLLAMIAFWTWLWGPIGLVLATPMTVCLVVFARHVPQLDSVRVLLSDEPAMDAKMSYYQRLLAMDLSEASDILRGYLAAHSREHAYDEVLLPAVSYAKADLRQNKITAPEYRSVLNASREILEALASGKIAPHACETADDARPSRKITIVGCPAHAEADTVALVMLRQLFDPWRYEVEIIPSGRLASEIAAVVAEKTPPLVCVAAVAPGGVAQLRYLCKRMRMLSADIKIVAAYWGNPGDIEGIRESLIGAGADQVGGSLCATRDQITNLRPFIAQIEASAQPHPVQRAATSL